METAFENIAIRPYVLGDIPRLYDAVIESAQTLGPWMSWYHPSYSIQDTQKWVVSQASAFARGEEYGFAIVDKQDRLLGACGVHHVERANKYGTMGYWTRAIYTGRGVATAGVKLLANWVYANTDLCRIEILCAVDNTAGCRVAEKAGAAFVGIMQQRVCLHSRMHDAAMYAFLRP